MGFLFDAREKFINIFKSNIFPLKNSTPKSAPKATLNPTVFYALNEKHHEIRYRNIKWLHSSWMKTLRMKLELIKQINNEIFKNYFGYQNPSFLVKELC